MRIYMLYGQATGNLYGGKWYVEKEAEGNRGLELLTVDSIEQTGDIQAKVQELEKQACQGQGNAENIVEWVMQNGKKIYRRVTIAVALRPCIHRCSQKRAILCQHIMAANGCWVLSKGKKNSLVLKGFYIKFQLSNKIWLQNKHV